MDKRDASYYVEQATKCWRLARENVNNRAKQELLAMARVYAAVAIRLRTTEITEERQTGERSHRQFVKQ